MNPQDPLALLRPLQLPETDFSWPLAPGWWLLAALLCIASLVAIATLYRYYQRRAVLRRAKIELQRLANQWTDRTRSNDAVIAINALIKATALHYQKDRTIARLSDTKWQSWLQRTTAPKYRSNCKFEFASQMYIGNNDQLWSNREATLQDCECWLAGHKGHHHA